MLAGLIRSLKHPLAADIRLPEAVAFGKLLFLASVRFLTFLVYSNASYTQTGTLAHFACRMFYGWFKVSFPFISHVLQAIDCHR